MNQYKIIHTKILPKWYIKNTNQKFNMLIIGCNSGEDIYNFGIIFYEFKKHFPDFDFQILAIDNNEKSINFSKRAIYHEDSISHIPDRIKHKYFLKSKNREKRLVRIVPELRAKVQFRKMESLENISFREKMDLIKINRKEFETLKIIKKLTTYFNKNGYLITKHTNIFLKSNPDFQELFPNVYYLS